MTTRTNRTWQAALVIGGVALAVAACGSSGSSTASSTGGGGNGSTTNSTSSIVSTESVNGTKALTDASGHTLYSTTAETNGHILCTGSCTNFWKPVMASQQQAMQAGTSVGAQLSIVSRPDGGSQLAYKGHPLYIFTQEGAHSTKGDGFKDNFGGTSFTWQAAVTSGSAAAAPSSSGSSSGSSGGKGGGYGY